MWPMEESTMKSLPKSALIRLALAGDSTMTRALPMARPFGYQLAQWSGRHGPRKAEGPVPACQDPILAGDCSNLRKCGSRPGQSPEATAATGVASAVSDP